MYSLWEDRIRNLTFTALEETIQWLSMVLGSEALRNVVAVLAMVEVKASADPRTNLHAYSMTPIPKLALPLPTNAKWREATAKDHDLSQVIKALETGKNPNKANFSDKLYTHVLSKGQLEHNGGLLYYYEKSVRSSL